MWYFSILHLECHIPVLLQIFTKENGEKEEEAGFDILSKINILKIIQGLNVCIHWNIEQLSKTKIIYTQGDRKGSQFQFKVKPVLEASGISRFHLSFAQRTVTWREKTDLDRVSYTSWGRQTLSRNQILSHSWFSHTAITRQWNRPLEQE